MSICKFFLFFWPFCGFVESTAEDDRKQGERGGSDTQQSDPGWESNPGPNPGGDQQAVFVSIHIKTEIILFLCCCWSID